MQAHSQVRFLYLLYSPRRNIEAQQEEQLQFLGDVIDLNQQIDALTWFPGLNDFIETHGEVQIMLGSYTDHVEIYFCVGASVEQVKIIKITVN